MEVRINKFLSEAGVCSRREADRQIEAGNVTIGGKTARMGDQVSDGQEVCFCGRPVQKEKEMILIALNKPAGIVCTAEKREKNNVIDFLHYPKRIYPVGRLDKESEGLLLLTNNGEIVNKIMRSGNMHEKEYLVTVNRPVTDAFLHGMANGVPLVELGTTTRKCRVERTGKKQFRIILTQGLNRQIRRMCRALDYHVMNLKRVRIMNIQLGTLKRGEYRELTEKELSDLMKLVEGSTNLPAREAAKIGKLVDPAKAAGKTARSGYQGKKNDRKPFVKNGERKPFEKKSGTGKVWRNVREDSEKKPEKKAPASPESWKPGAPERKEHKIWTTRSRG